MLASAWTNGRNTYGIRVSKHQRDLHFDMSQSTVDVEVDGIVHTFRLTRSFWENCPEIRDAGKPILQRWLNNQGLLGWPPYSPSRVKLISLAVNRFRLETL